MYDLRPGAFEHCFADLHPAANRHAVLRQNALGRFNAARRSATIEQLKQRLFGRACRLLNLSAIPCSQVRGRHYGGIQSVNVSQICGSMDRSTDFDHHFNPCGDRLRDRWLSVAMARSLDIPLPLINLVQVGDRYFVEDGHHRISVARAMGEVAIDAEITVWDVRGPLPWERPTAPRLTAQPA
jgi:hypothetical protein